MHGISFVYMAEALFSPSSLQPANHLPSCDPENLHARGVLKDRSKGDIWDFFSPSCFICKIPLIYFRYIVLRFRYFVKGHSVHPDSVGQDRGYLPCSDASFILKESSTKDHGTRAILFIRVNLVILLLEVNGSLGAS